MGADGSARMNREAQALADALCGNVRLWVPVEAWTQAHVRNLLLKAGVPVIWERGNIRVEHGRITCAEKVMEHVYEVLWEPSEPMRAHQWRPLPEPLHVPASSLY